MKVDTTLSYENNLLTEKAYYFKNSLVWYKIGQKYLEAKASGTYDDTIFPLVHKAVKGITYFVKGMGEIQLKTKIEYNK